METNKLEWLRGPLPPVSESILVSGLLNESASSSAKKIIQKNINNQKKVFQSAPAPISKTAHKIPFKPTHVLSVKSKKQSSFDSSLKPLNLPIVPAPQVSKNYKAPPIDETALTFKKSTAPSIPKENLTEKVLMVKQSNYREFIQNLVYELDSNIASIVPVSPEAISPEEQASVKSQLMEFYNYSFNELILKEKTVSSDKAILLRRFMTFYNQILNDYPYVVESLKSKNQQYIDNISDLQNQINDLKQKIDDLSDSLQKAEESNTKIKEQLEKAIDDSNSKDITISTISYDYDLSKSQFNHIQFSYNQLKEENQKLSNSLKHRDEEIKGQLIQIENMTKKLADYQQGDTGYISMYHQEKNKIEKLEKTINELNQKIYNLENIEKTSIAVDTSDIPIIKIKKKKMVKVPSASNSSTNLPQPEDGENSHSLVNQKKKGNQIPKPTSHSVGYAEISTQTSTSGTFSISIENESVSFCVNLAEIEGQNSDNQISASNLNKIEKEKSNSDFFNVSEYLIQLKVPDGYDIDEKLAKIPSLQKFVMPLFSEIYVQNASNGLKIIDKNVDQISIQSEKPLIWGLQLIHSFLTDPFIRSLENKNRLSNEDIFVDWVSKQYKIQHLVNQVFVDISRILSRFRYDEMICLFIDLLEGTYNFSQLCFLSTVYSFSCTLTNPNIVQLYKNFESYSNDEIKIHIKTAHKLYALCFADDIADNFVREFVSQTNSNLDEKKSDIQEADFDVSGKNNGKGEMINFFYFLRKITEFFGEKHRLISNQARDLLSLVGCTDTSIILFDVFESFMTMLGCSQISIKNDWKSIVARFSKSERPFVTIKELLELCAEKDTPLQCLLSIPSLKKSIGRIKSMSQIVYELYHEFIGRFSKSLPRVFALLSPEIKEKVTKTIQKLKTAILEADIQKMIWFYKKLLAKIDRLKMKEMGFIPFDYKADTDAINHLSQYIKKAEDVSFALLAV